MERCLRYRSSITRRPGAAGALFFEACAPAAFFGGGWPSDVPVEIHGMESDRLFVDEGNLDAARELVATAPRSALYLYPGDLHLFPDSSLLSYDAAATALLIKRVLYFLNGLG